MVEKWRHHWSCWRSEFLYYYWSQPHHQAGPPLRYCQLYLCCQKHRRQEEKHNGNCHSLWWVNSVCLNLVQVKLQFLIWMLGYQVKRALLSPHCSSLPASPISSWAQLSTSFLALRRKENTTTYSHPPGVNREWRCGKFGFSSSHIHLGFLNFSQRIMCLFNQQR